MMKIGVVRWGNVLIWLAMPVVALLAGLAASTANPVLVALFAGLVLAAILLGKPALAVSLLILAGLTHSAVLSILNVGSGRIGWGVALLGFFLFVPALLNAGRLKQAPAFVHVTLAFMVYALGVTLLQDGGVAEAIAGVKRHFQAFGLLLALALYPFAARDFAGWKKLLLIIVALQLPFALYEFLILVPKRGGLAAGSEVTDVVAGTFGASLAGGSPNSVMAVFLLIFMAFMFARWKAGLLKAKWVALGLVFALVPIGLGEVKVVFVMLPLVFLVVFKDELRRRPGFFIGASLLGGVLFFLLGYVLLEWVMKKSLFDVIENTIAYNTAETAGYAGGQLNRLTALTFWWQQQGLHDPVGFLFGHGMGSSHAEGGALVAGHMARKWPTHGIGLTAAAQLLWDVGMLGFGMYLLMLGLAWRTAGRIRKFAADPQAGADAAAIQAAIALFAVMLIYNNSLIVILSLQIVFGLVFGYLAHLHRTNGGARQAR
jgi:hypothetical protein